MSHNLGAKVIAGVVVEYQLSFYKIGNIAIPRILQKYKYLSIQRGNIYVYIFQKL